MLSSLFPITKKPVRLSRVSGSHHIYVHSKTTELVNLQKINSQAKPFQVRQFMDLVEKNNLKLED
jgi:hypothetical protein